MALSYLSLLRACVGASVLLACEVPRPQWAYTPVEPDASASLADDDEDVYGDAGGPPLLDDEPVERDAGSAPDDGEPAEDEQGPAPGDEQGEPSPAESALVGDYWMRSTSQLDATVSQLGLSFSSRTDTAVYSLVRVGYQQGALKLVDWQCATKIVQRCLRGCSSLSTTLADPVKSSKAFAPATRALEVRADGSFHAGPAPYAVGWKGDFVADPAARLPTEQDDPLVYDPDGGRGKGIDVTSSVRLSSGLAMSCSMRLVQRYDLAYTGTLTGGALEAGVATDLGSAQSVLASTCSSAAGEATSARPSTLRFVRRPVVVGASSWTCPTLAELEAAFED